MKGIGAIVFTEWRKKIVRDSLLNKYSHTLTDSNDRKFGVWHMLNASERDNYTYAMLEYFPNVMYEQTLNASIANEVKNLNFNVASLRWAPSFFAHPQLMAFMWIKWNKFLISCAYLDRPLWITNYKSPVEWPSRIFRMACKRNKRLWPRNLPNISRKMQIFIFWVVLQMKIESSTATWTIVIDRFCTNEIEFDNKSAGVQLKRRNK